MVKKLKEPIKTRFIIPSFRALEGLPLVQGLYPSLKTYAEAPVLKEPAGVAAVFKIRRTAENRGLVRIGASVPGAELSAVAALVAVGIDMHNLKGIVKLLLPRGFHLYIGPVGADIDALVAEEIAFKTAGLFGGAEGRRVVVGPGIRPGREMPFLDGDVRRPLLRIQVGNKLAPLPEGIAFTADGVGGPAAFGDAVDDGGCPGPAVSDEKDVFPIRLPAFPGGNHALCIGLETCALQSLGIGIITHSINQAVRLNLFRPVRRNRAPPPRFVGFSQLHDPQGKTAVGAKAFRVPEPAEGDPVLRGVFVLLPAGGHLFEGPAVGNLNLLDSGTAQGRPGAVHGGVPGPDNHDPAAHLKAGGVAVELGQEGEGWIDPLAVTLYGKLSAPVGSETQNNIGESFFFEGFNIDLLIHPEAEFHSVLADKIYVPVNGLPAYPEVGHHVAHDTAGILFPLKDGYGKTFPGKEIGRRKPRGPCSYDSDPLRMPDLRLDPAALILLHTFEQGDLLDLPDVEGALNIREVKKISLLKGMEEYQRRWVKPEIRHPERIAVVGAGPAGLSAAYFLAREGFSVTVLEREEDAGGVVRYVVPHFRISREAIDRDIDFIRQHGVEFRFGVDEKIDIEALKKEGFTYIVLGLGTYRSRKLPIEGDSQRIYPSLSFLTQFNRDPSRLKVGRRVVVIGAGDTAMDCARAALRCSGVEEVQIAYRRAFEQMPASREEYEYAAEDGISFRWLRNPERFSADGSLTLRVMELGEPDESGRRRPVPTDRTEEIKADSLIYAVGDDPDSEALKSAGLEPDAKGMVPTGEGGETDRENIFLIGDSRTGASTIVNCIAEGRRAADAICRKSDSLWERSELIPYLDPEERTADIAVKKGHLSSRPDPRSDYDSASFCATEKSRCLECDFLCNKCVDVCPNRANIKVETAGQEQFDDAFQIVHIDAYCNECGNCGQFCPWDGRPYADKPTVFSSPADFENSSNPGWLLENGSLRVRFQGRVQTLDQGEAFKRSEGRDDEARFYRLFELLHHRRPHLFTRLSAGGAA